MEMCYDGTLVMPSSYAVMSEDEMTYVEGGGTFRVKASKSTVRTICRSGVSLICAAIGAIFGSKVGALLSGAVGRMIFDYIISVSKVKFPSINKTWSKKALPTYTLNLNNYV